MSGTAFLAADHRDRALDYARIELEQTLAWVEHWQRDVAARVIPTQHSLKVVETNIRDALREIRRSEGRS